LSIARSHKLPTVERILGLVEKSLDDDKAEAIATLSLTGKSAIADYMVVATGRNARQIAAMADHLATKLKAEGLGKVAVEGLKTCEWVLIDCGDIIVHLFRPEIRTFYNLEKMWGMDMPGDRPTAATGKSRARA
jgi:ribosome-associated protein